MTSYILDAYTWIEYLEGSTRGTKVRNIIENPRNKIHTCAVTLAEIISKFIRRNLDQKIALDAITSNSRIIPVDDKLSLLAGELHAQIRKNVKDFGLADAYVLACSKKYDAVVITGDPHFRTIKDVMII